MVANPGPVNTILVPVPLIVQVAEPVPIVTLEPDVIAPLVVRAL